ncbi:hypothetical protein [Legionella busanensis]|uniref:hypothetical protein n=1 Tax=Legionella busanensis TaxID=190655 RepID=UPI000E1C1615|nr:hypothetical protein [Legionella busanensis]
MVDSVTGRIKGGSLTIPRSRQAEITFKNPIIEKAYTNFANAFQEKVTDATRLMKNNLQAIVGMNKKN